MIRMCKPIIAAFLFVLLFFLSSCGGRNGKKEHDIDFTVCNDSKLPDELLQIINEKKDKEFKLSYVNSSYMYIAVGYGEMPRANYNVVVEKLYSTGKAVFIETNLFTEQMTPSDAIARGESSMFPYIVIKCEKYDVPIIYDIE